MALVDTKQGLDQQVFECLRFWNAAYQINQDLETLKLYHQVKTEISDVRLDMTANLLNFDGNNRKFKAKVWISLDAQVLKTFPCVRVSPEKTVNGLGIKTKIFYSSNSTSNKNTDMCARIEKALKDRGTVGLTEVFNKVVVEC